MKKIVAYLVLIVAPITAIPTAPSERNFHYEKPSHMRDLVKQCRRRQQVLFGHHNKFDNNNEDVNLDTIGSSSSNPYRRVGASLSRRWGGATGTLLGRCRSQVSSSSTIKSTTNIDLMAHSTSEYRKFDRLQDNILLGTITRQVQKFTSKQGIKFPSFRRTKSQTSVQSAATEYDQQVITDTTRIDEQHSSTEDNPIIQLLSQPLIDEEIWNGLDGTEFQRYPELWNQLAIMGINLALDDEPNEWIDWKKLSQTTGSDNDDTIHVWTGKSKNSNVRGSTIPLIKTRSIIPYRPEEFTDLLLDSSRVQTYNKFSVGRHDCWVATTSSTVTSSSDSTQQQPYYTKPLALTKIVKNRIQPPLGAKQMISTTFMHAQPIQSSSSSSSDTNNSNPSWIVVSRAVNGKSYDDSGNESGLGKSEILLGINYLQPYSNNRSVLTAITHVYSSAIPSMLAERVGVKSAIQFINDMRSLKVTQQQQEEKQYVTR